MSKSLGTIKVELELDDKNFSIRTIKAGETIKKMSRSFDKGSKSVRRMEKSVTGLLPKLRDIAITASILKGGLHNLYNVTLGWQKSIIDTNAKIERMTFLLKGMSNEITELGRNNDAAESMKFLFDMAERAPFSLGELSNSLVKMKSVGLKDAEEGVKSLTDAVASFGGTDETLHRASVAIQQMAGKGVISMEELRQQLGEAVPSAIRLMARSMGMTYQELVNAISTGRVEANEALERMFREMDRTMGGSGQRMMETWSGMVAKLETRWTKFQVAIGDAGGFQAAKDALGKVIDEMDPEQVAAIAQAWGNALGDIVNGLVSVVEFLQKHGSMVMKVTKAIVTMFVAWKGVAIMTTALKTAKKNLLLYRTAVIAAGTTTTTMARGYSSLGGGIARTTAKFSMSAGLARTAMKGVGTAVTALGGPIGALVTVLSLAAVAWSIFGDAAEDAWDSVEKGDKILDKASLNVIKTEIMARQSEILKLKADIDRLNSGGMTITERVTNTSKESLVSEKLAKLRDLESGIKSMSNRIFEAEMRLTEQAADFGVEMFQKKLAKKTANVQSIYRDASVRLADEYTKNEGQDGAMTAEQYREAQAQLIKELYDEKIKIYETESKILEKLIAKKGGNERAILIAQQKHANEAVGDMKKARANQVAMALKEFELMDKPGAGNKSKLENFFDSVTAKSADFQAELAGLSGDLAKFDHLITSGAFGTEGEALLAGKLIDGKTLADYRAAVAEAERLNQENVTAKKLKREAISAEKTLRLLSNKTTQERTTALKMLKTGVDDSYVGKINRQLDELLQKMPDANKEIKALAETIRAEALDKQNILNMHEMIEGTKKINRDLLTDNERFLAERDDAMEKARAKFIIDETTSNEQKIAMEKALQEHLIAIQEEYVRKTESPMQTMLREWEDVTQKMQDASARWLDSASDKLTEFVMTGKTDFSSLAESIISDIIKMQIQAALSGIFSSDGSEGGGGGIMDIIGGIFGFANGGIMSSSGKMDLSAYASGGIANSPQLALYGEGSMNEAYVPLPDGKTIPVTMSGGNGGNMDVSVNLINQTSQPVNAEQSGGPRFDGKRLILDVVLTEMSKAGSFRDGMRSSVR